jgi:DNA polymerase III epsilon subunit family exonuclease
MKFELFSEVVGKPVADLSFDKIDVKKKRRDLSCSVVSIFEIKNKDVSEYVHKLLNDGIVYFSLRSDGVWRVVGSKYLRLTAKEEDSVAFLKEILTGVEAENLVTKPRVKRLNPKFDLMPGRRYVAIDVETTGLYPFSGDRIIQLAALDISDYVHSNGLAGESFKSVVSKFNPQMPIPAEASAVNRIYDHAVADAPLFADYAKTLTDFIGDAILVGHNVKFDIGFVNAELQRLGLPTLSNDSYCTYKNARNILGDTMGYRGRFNLDSVRQHLKIPSAGASHDALNDAKVAARIFNVLVRTGLNQPEKTLIETKSDDATSLLVGEASSYQLNATYDLILGKKYVAISMETTGKHPSADDRIIQLAALDITQVNNLPKTPQFTIPALTTKFNPERAIPKESSEVHNIYDSDVLESPRFSEHADSIVEFLGDAILVGHDIKLSIDFLNAELARVGKPPLANQFYCIQTNALIKLGKYKPLISEFTLEGVRKFLGIDRSAPRHDSVADGMVVARIFNMLVHMDTAVDSEQASVELKSDSSSSSLRMSSGSYIFAILVILVIVIAVYQVLNHQA